MAIKPLDLANKGDFLLATGSSIATIAMLFGKKADEWDIEEASYNDVVFHVFKSKQQWNGSLSSIRDSGGRRLAQHKFPYRDGQTTDDLGREPETFEIDALLFGERYKEGMRQLFAELQKSSPGELLHPVRGLVTCKMLRYDMTHSHDSRKAVAIKITFVEHNFSLASYGKFTFYVPNFKSKLADLMAVFAMLQALKNKIKAAQNLVNAVINEINTLVDSFNNTFIEVITMLNKIFNNNESLDIPAVVPVTESGLVNSDGSYAATTYPSAVNDPFAAVPINQIKAQIAASNSILPSTAANISNTLGAVVAQQQVNNARNSISAVIDGLSRVKFNAEKLAIQATPAGNPTISGGVPIAGMQTIESDGALEYCDEILSLKRTAILLQDAYEAGMKQAKLGMKLFMTPRVMSSREVAWANGLSPERSIEIDLLNPELDSMNYIAANTEVFVPL